MSGTQRRLTGRIQVALPPAEAFRLFTPRGEQDWAHGWHPHFPAPVTDDTDPGTVFETHAHDQHTIWLVTGRVLEHWHTGAMTRRARVLDHLEPEPTVQIAPDDLARLGVSPG